MPEMPEYIPDPIDVDLMRHQIIDGETYVNLHDLVQVLAMKMNDLDNASKMLVNQYQHYAFPTAAALFNMGTTVGMLYSALKSYADAAVFDSIINTKDEEPNE